MFSVCGGYAVSPLINSRHAARRRPSRTGVPLSPWHLVGLGLVALLGTGILAAVDRSGEKVGASQADPNRPQRAGVAQVAAVVEPVQAPAVDTARAPVAPRPGAAQAATPANGGATSPTPRPGETPAAAPAFAPVMSAPAVGAAEQRPQPAEGPVATASLAQPAPPAQPLLSASPQGAARGAVKTNATASTDCLPAELRAVLADVAARFGEVAVVSTHQLNTVNHSSGSIREKLHNDCKAVDFRPDRSRIEEIKAYLRTRPGIGGIESYRNGIVHVDVSGTATARSRPRPGRAQAAAQTVPDDALQAAPALPSPPQAAGPFTPALLDRDR